MLRHDDTWRTLLGLPATTAAALSHAPPAVRSERTDDKDFISDAKNGEWINANPRCIKDDKVRAWTTWLFEWRTWIVPTFLLLFVFIHFFQSDSLVLLVAGSGILLTVLSAWSWWRITMTYRQFLLDVKKFQGGPASG